MRRSLVAWGPVAWGLAWAVLPGCMAALPALAQEAPDDGPTAEQMIEVAREAYRPPGLRRKCPPPERPGEIVVCAPDPDEYRVSSPTDDAIAAGEPVADGVPRAPDVFGLPPCNTQTVCMKVGRAPPPIYIIDLEAIPEPLTPEQAAKVFRAEDLETAEP